MEALTARLSSEWHVLSSKHAELKEESEQILQQYRDGGLERHAYLIKGVYGQGKSALLFFLFRRAKEMGLFPVLGMAAKLFLADDASAEKVPMNYADLKEWVDAKVQRAVEAIADRRWEEVELWKGFSQDVLTDMQQFYENATMDPDRLVLLVDELEDVYQKLVEHVGADPLRGWLQDSKYLKVVALTPAGVHDLGTADRQRLGIFLIPTVDPLYIRDHYGLPAGKANAAWWLSRGVPRNIIKNVETLRKVTDQELRSPYELERILQNLDPIGKAADKVPAVALKRVKGEHRPIVVDLRPQNVERQLWGIEIRVEELQEAELIQPLQLLFDIQEKQIATAFAYYLRKLALLISDEEQIAYIPDSELKDFFKLAMDLMIFEANEDPAIRDHFDQIPLLAEAIDKQNESRVAKKLDGKSGILEGDLSKKLPIEIGQVGQIFPFPIANPVLFTVPRQVLEQWEADGKPGSPLIAGKIGGTDFLFFVRYQDMAQYSTESWFLDATLPDGKKMILLLPKAEYQRWEDDSNRSPLLDWLKDDGRLEIQPVEGLLESFLLSVWELHKEVPVRWADLKNRFQASEDYYARRKFELYGSAIEEVLADIDRTLQPTSFIAGKKEPEGIQRVWGDGYLKDAEIAVTILLLGLLSEKGRLSSRDEQQLLKLSTIVRNIQSEETLREILQERSGLATLIQQLPSPRKSPLSGGISRKQYLREIAEFFADSEYAALRQLARFVELEDFYRLAPSENYRRLLEAVWRLERQSFTQKRQRFEELRQRFQSIYEGMQKLQQHRQHLADQLGVPIAGFVPLLSHDTTGADTVQKWMPWMQQLSEIEFEEAALRHLMVLLLGASGFAEKFAGEVEDLQQRLARFDTWFGQLQQQEQEIETQFRTNPLLKELLEEHRNWGEELQTLLAIESRIGSDNEEGIISADDLESWLRQVAEELQELGEAVSQIVQQGERIESLLRENGLLTESPTEVEKGDAGRYQKQRKGMVDTTMSLLEALEQRAQELEALHEQLQEELQRGADMSLPKFDQVLTYGDLQRYKDRLRRAIDNPKYEEFRQRREHLGLGESFIAFLNREFEQGADLQNIDQILKTAENIHQSTEHWPALNTLVLKKTFKQGSAASVYQQMKRIREEVVPAIEGLSSDQVEHLLKEWNVGNQQRIVEAAECLQTINQWFGVQVVATVESIDVLKKATELLGELEAEEAQEEVVNRFQQKFPEGVRSKENAVEEIKELLEKLHRELQAKKKAMLRKIQQYLEVLERPELSGELTYKEAEQELQKLEREFDQKFPTVGKMLREWMGQEDVDFSFASEVERIWRQYQLVTGAISKEEAKKIVELVKWLEKRRVPLGDPPERKGRGVVEWLEEKQQEFESLKSRLGWYARFFGVRIAGVEELPYSQIKQNLRELEARFNHEFASVGKLLREWAKREKVDYEWACEVERVWQKYRLNAAAISKEKADQIVQRVAQFEMWQVPLDSLPKDGAESILRWLEKREEHFKRLREKVAGYYRLFNEGKEIPKDYPTLQKEKDRCEKQLRIQVGEAYFHILEFLQRSDATRDMLKNVSREEMVGFLELVRPHLREVLSGDSKYS